MQKKWVRMLFRRRVAVIFMLVLQAALMVYMVYSSSRTYKGLYYFLYVMSLVVVLYVISTGSRSSSKLLWSVTILSFPLFGGLLYLLVKWQGFTTSFKRRLAEANEASKPLLQQDKTVLFAMEEAAPDYARQSYYLTQTCGCCAYADNGTSYLSPGEKKYEKLIWALGQAERFIFLEYFIIQEGKFWDDILDILTEKAKNGVDVRVIYDDMGCFMLLPIDYQKTLSARGIRCVVFNKFRPVLSTLQNNRDHRKIAVIDGKFAFTGGINLADEYINAYAKHGHWKDAAVMVSGAAVNSYTLMFLEMWQTLTGEKENFADYIVAAEDPQPLTKGFIIPYCDSPIDDEDVGERVYMNLINGAQDYVYIQTPYLIIDDVMLAALIRAAKNGVDVRIVTPHVPDKWYVHMTTRSFYPDLLAGGVKIYEYTPGFIHSKVLVSDDRIATVGTINFDCRSLYLHFECGAWLFDSPAVTEIREDFMKTLESCGLVTEKDCKTNVCKRLVQRMFRLFAPLM